MVQNCIKSSKFLKNTLRNFSEQLFFRILPDRCFCRLNSRHLLVPSQQWNYQNNCEICLKLTIKTTERCHWDVVLVCLLLTLNRFHTFFRCFHCWLCWASKCWLGCGFAFRQAAALSKATYDNMLIIVQQNSTKIAQQNI